MSIRSKLLIVVLILVGLLAVGAVYLGSSSLSASSQLQEADLAIEDLHGVAVLRLRLHRCVNALAGYVYTGDERALSTYERLRPLAQQSLDRWAAARRRRAHPLVPQASDSESVLSLLDRTADLKTDGRGEDARRNLREDVLGWHGSLSGTTAALLRLEEDRVRESYDLLLLRLGSFPWISRRVQLDVTRARRSLGHFMAAEAACSSVSRSLSLDGARTEATQDLDRWIALMVDEARTPGRSMGFDLQSAREAKKKYGEVARLLADARRLAIDGREAEARAVVYGRAWPLVDEYVLPKVAKGYDEFRLSVYEAHRSLGSDTRGAALSALGGALVLSTLLLLTTLHILQGLIRSLARLEAGAEALGAGDLSHRVALPGRDELARLSASFDRMAADLERTTVSKERLQSLAAQLVLVEEEERRKLAAVLHDQVGQILALLRIKLKALAAQLEDGAPAEELSALVENAIAQTRSLTLELSPPVLYELGLAAALEGLAERVREQHGLVVTLQADAAEGSIALEPRVVLYQATREAVRNALKHARARSLRISVAFGPRDAMIEVTDDGVGFDARDGVVPWREGHGFGLFSLRERLGALGGSLTVQSTPGSGTRVRFQVPRLEKEAS